MSGLHRAGLTCWVPGTTMRGSAWTFRTSAWTMRNSPVTPGRTSAARAQPGSLSAANRRRALARARTCYDHLAGALGVLITEAMTRRGLLDWGQGPALTSDGARWFAALGIALPSATRRPLVRSCLDWTERRPHLAGAAGAALCGHALNSGWITRIGSGRAVALTGTGRNAIREHLGLVPAA